MLATLQGLDHVVIMVRDLDAGAQRWRDLGFTVSPRGTHSAHLGTGNHTIMLDDDYLELLGILAETELNTPSRAFLARRGEGLERAAFRTADAQGGVDALAARGIAARGPVHFSRPVDLPGGGAAEAAFSVFHWPVVQRPADVRIFACQHRTRDSVWIPELMAHANTACGIDRLDVIARDPEAAARQMADLIDGDYQAGDQGVRVETGPGRAGFMFMTKQSFVKVYGDADNFTLPDEGVGALVLRVRDMEAAARCAGPDAIRSASAIVVPPANATGVMVVFQPA